MFGGGYSALHPAHDQSKASWLISLKPLTPILHMWLLEKTRHGLDNLCTGRL